jgi:hypothetical protein
MTIDALPMNVILIATDFLKNLPPQKARIAKISPTGQARWPVVCASKRGAGDIDPPEAGMERLLQTHEQVVLEGGGPR